jgi:hypothetical protein
MRTGSLVRSAGSLAPDLAGTDRCWTSEEVATREQLEEAAEGENELVVEGA